METSPRLARKACLQCRRSKRRCSRRLPSCELCLQKEAQCSYPGTITTSPNSSSSYNSGDTYARSSETGTDAVGCNTGALYFIAPRTFRQARLELPRPDVSIPTHVASLVGDTASIRDIATTFFETIHGWMPIISKRTFFTHLLNPLARRQTELNLLAVCMLLCTTTPSTIEGESSGKIAIYQTAKAFYLEVEATNTLSIHVLQAAVLIAIYEVCQAIFPAAYLTVGSCARYGAALGIDRLDLDLMGESLGPLSWIEVEERRRVWWAVLLLDR